MTAGRAEFLPLQSVLILTGEFQEEFPAMLNAAFVGIAQAVGALRPGTEIDVAAVCPLIIMLSEGQSVESMDEEQMRAHGWVRIEDAST